MFKKMVLVGLLAVLLVVLSGCGTYDVDFKSDNNYFSYGGFYVPKIGGSGDLCTGGDPQFKKVGNLCLAVGDGNRCKQLPVGSGLKVDWISRNVPKYDANFCALSCDLNVVDSCGKKAVCYQLPDKSMNICAPDCTTDADCLPGLTSCKEIFGPKFCVPNDDLSKAPQPQFPIPPPPLGLNELRVDLELRADPEIKISFPYGSGGFPINTQKPFLCFSQ